MGPIRSRLVLPRTEPINRQWPPSTARDYRSLTADRPGRVRERRKHRRGCALWMTRPPGADVRQLTAERRLKEDRMIFGSRLKGTMVEPEKALRGRDSRPYTVPATHAVLGTPLE